MSDGTKPKFHIRIPRDKIRHGEKKPRQRPIKKEEQRDFKEYGKELINQLEISIKYCRRPQKIIEDEDIFFVLHTEKPISYQGKMLDRFNLHFSLQVDEFSAVVSIGSENLQSFRNALEKYKDASNLRSYLDQIESISLVNFNRVSPELNSWLASSESLGKVEIEILPNLDEEKYTTVCEKIITFLRKQGDQILETRIREKNASIRVLLKPQTAKMESRE